MSFARVRALVVIGVLAVAAVVFVVVALVRDTPGRRGRRRRLPGRRAAGQRDAARGPGRGQDQDLQRHQHAGLADKVTTDFKNRGFQMQKPGESKTKFERIAVITVRARRRSATPSCCRAYFLGKAKPQYNAKRTRTTSWTS